MQTNKVFIPAKIKTKLDNMNLSDRFLFNETVEDPEIYNMIVEILMDEHISMFCPAVASSFRCGSARR